MRYDNLLKNDIFPIAVGDEFGMAPERVNILYSPFTDRALLVTDDYLPKIERQVASPSPDCPRDVADTVSALTDYGNRFKTARMNTDPLRYNRLTILPNNVCNFHCSYCYSAHGRNGKVIDPDVLKAALDHFIDSSRIEPANKLAIAILGGGEPMVSWDITRHIIEYAHQRSSDMGFAGMEITLVTNGSIMTDEMIDVLKRYHVIMSVSFEILEEIQDLQRGHYKEVSQNIDRLIAAGIRPQLRSCITLDNIHLMKRMVEEVLTRFPGTREVMMEYVTDPERLTDSMQVRDFYRRYLDNFLEAYDYADEHGLFLDCSARRNYELLVRRFCPGDNTLTPDGKISICSRISSPKDPGYEASIYGSVDADGTVTIDNPKFEHLIGLDVDYYPQCLDCFAKWHCGGGCMIHKHTYSQEIRDEICIFTRNFTKRMLLRQLDKEYRQNHGLSLRELIETNLTR